jgi:hypothetical protein
MRCFVRFVRVFFAVSFVALPFMLMPFMLTHGRGATERFAGEQFDNVRRRGRERGRYGWLIGVRVPVVIVFEIFENVADVEEGITI